MNGKIIQPELINRKNDKETNQPISFEYDLLVENETGNKTELPFRFNRLGEKTWLVEMVFGSDVKLPPVTLNHFVGSIVVMMPCGENEFCGSV